MYLNQSSKASICSDRFSSWSYRQSLDDEDMLGEGSSMLLNSSDRSSSWSHNPLLDDEDMAGEESVRMEGQNLPPWMGQTWSLLA